MFFIQWEKLFALVLYRVRAFLDILAIPSCNINVARTMELGEQLALF